MSLELIQHIIHEFLITINLLSLCLYCWDQFKSRMPCMPSLNWPLLLKLKMIFPPIYLCVSSVFVFVLVGTV